MRRAVERWEKRILECADWVYINSMVGRDMLCEHYHMNKDKFLVIPNGYMQRLYANLRSTYDEENCDERDHMTKQLRKDNALDGKFVVTFVGSLKKWHGITTLCEIAALLQEDDQIRFLVLGDGEMRQEIHHYVTNHQNMLYIGKVSMTSMARYLRASDLGIMPYMNQENFFYSPLKMFDMIGAGLPFIATATGQIAQLCKEDFDARFLVKEPTPQCFADSIRQIKSNDLQKDMREKVLEKRASHSWDARARILIDGIK
jgi:glycosyltransferase involved in cell wall biosynthesis